MTPNSIRPPWAAIPLPLFPHWLLDGHRAVSPPETERRASPRMPCRLLARVTELGPTGRRTWVALVYDVSDTGLALEAAAPPAAGTSLEVDLSDATGQHYGRVTARVVHTGPLASSAWVIGCAVAAPVAIA